MISSNLFHLDIYVIIGKDEVIVMILEKLRERKRFTNSEKLIAEYVLKHPEQLYQLSVEELGKETYTSKATVIRLCKKLEVNSYQEFKRQVEFEYNELSRISSLLKDEPVDENSTYQDIVKVIPTIYDKSIVQTRLDLDQNKMIQVINRLSQAKRISIYGTGISYTIASQAAFKIMTLGKECDAHSGINEHFILSQKNSRQCVAILISFTGNNSEMIKIAKYLKKAGIYAIAIGGKKGELQNYCDIYLNVYSSQDILSLEVITSFTATMYVLDVIFVSLLVKDYQSNVTTALKVIDFENKK